MYFWKKYKTEISLKFLQAIDLSDAKQYGEAARVFYEIIGLAKTKHDNTSVYEAYMALYLMSEELDEYENALHILDELLLFFKEVSWIHPRRFCMADYKAQEIRQANMLYKLNDLKKSEAILQKVIQSKNILPVQEHYTFNLLGLIAFQRFDRDNAKNYLLASITVPKLFEDEAILRHGFETILVEKMMGYKDCCETLLFYLGWSTKIRQCFLASAWDKDVTEEELMKVSLMGVGIDDYYYWGKLMDKLGKTQEMMQIWEIIIKLEERFSFDKPERVREIKNRMALLKSNN
jgi:tetratricopeptide (TPR) repeat protein